MIALPPGGSSATSGALWWRIIDGQVTQRGDSLDWLQGSAGGGLAPETHIIGIAPAADTILHRAAFPGLTSRQAEAAARLLAAEQSIAPAAALHVAVGADDDGSNSRDIIAVAEAAMVGWLDWASRHGIELASIVPAALLIPLDAAPGASPDTLVRGTLAGETIIRGADTAFLADPVLVDHIVGSEGRLIDATPDHIESVMIAACDTPPTELRSGRFARKPASWFDGALVRRAAMLAGAILLVSLAIAIARIAVTYADTARLDSAAATAAAAALDPDPPVENAVAALDARLAALGGGPARFSAPLAALVSAMEAQPTVTIDTLSWRGDGLLSVTLGAPRAEDINPVLLALQTRGYVITAQPRSGNDGRALGDITIRSGP
jgi:general secretion pathway protein L